METWLESVYSDGSAAFVSNPFPTIGDVVTVRLRMYEDAPVKHVILRSIPNGMEHYEDMAVCHREGGLVYYEAPLKIVEKRTQYQFYLICENTMYYYTQKQITTCLPGQTYDFVILADLEQPHWVKEAVFYQIFPERFCNGDPGNDVKDAEYSQNGFPTIQVKDWNTPPMPYDQAHCLDFYGGDLQGIQQKIPYLKALGVTALYLNPIFFAPTVHKYDCLDYFHVDPHFGGDEALEQLSKALHENGMKLILDISINHTGVAHKWFNRDGIWFDKSVGAYNNATAKERAYYFFEADNSYHGWNHVDTMPTLNYTSDALHNIIYRGKDSVIKKWLNPPYCIDGWRFDVADTLGRNGKVQLDRELWPALRRSIKEENPESYILAEDWGDCPEHLQGDSWDSPMNYFGCARIIRSFLGEPDLFLGHHPIIRRMGQKIPAQDVQERVMEHLAKMPYAMWENQFNLIDSHDTPRLHNNPEIHPEEYRGAVIFQFILPGAPSIYYGDEAGIDGDTDSMEGCRYPMPWGKDFQNAETYRLHRTLIQLRHNHKALTHGGMKFLYAQEGVVAIARFWGSEVFVAVISNSDADVSVRLPLGAVGAVRPKREVFGNELTYTAQNRCICLEVKAHHSYLFECT